MDQLNDVLWSLDEDDDIIELQGTIEIGCNLKEGCEDTGVHYIIKCFRTFNSGICYDR